MRLVPLPLRRALLLAALALLIVPAAAAGVPAPRPEAKRIVAIGGSIAEILAALGLEDRIAAIDLTASFPMRLKDKPSVGYMRSLNAEGVLALAPDLILAIEGSGPSDAIEVLQRASVPFVEVPEARNAAEVGRKIRFVAAAVGAPERGEALAAAVESDFAALERLLAPIESRRRAIFVMGVGGGAPNAAGQNTAADAMLDLAHVRNAITGYRGYKTVVDEAARAAAPDAVVTMADGGRPISAEAIFALPAFADTPAARDRRLVAMSGAYLLGFGPRTAHAARDLAAAVYPELKLAELPPRPWTQDAAGAAR